MYLNRSNDFSILNDNIFTGNNSLNNSLVLINNYTSRLDGINN
jgi:hypothetical protein